MIDDFAALALAGGDRIMKVLAAGCSVEWKADKSPVTVADQEAEAIILEGLRARYPGTPVIAEEEIAAGRWPDRIADHYFLVDPLDGTREFVNGLPDFTVNIALVEDGVPLLGAVYAPARNELYLGQPGLAEACATDAAHRIVSRRRITTRPPAVPPIVVASRSHRTAETDAYLATIPEAEVVSIGSSLKFCLIAAGMADCYPRFGPANQWDIAAGDAVLRAAGGRTLGLDGQPVTYRLDGQPQLADLASPWFVADGGTPISPPR